MNKKTFQPKLLQWVSVAVIATLLGACGGPATGGGAITVTENKSGALKIGEATPFQAVFKDTSGATQSKTFVWTSSDPSIASVDTGGNVTGKRFGKVRITASAEGVAGTSVEQTTYGLEVTGGTHNVPGSALLTSALVRFRLPGGNAVPANTPYTVTFSGPTAWNNGASIAVGPVLFEPGAWFTLGKPALSGNNYIASTVILGVAYSAPFGVADATQSLPVPMGIKQAAVSTTSSASATWNAVPGSEMYTYLVLGSQGFQGRQFTKTANGSLAGMGLDKTKSYLHAVFATSFDFTQNVDVPAPTQFNMSANSVNLTF